MLGVAGMSARQRGIIAGIVLIGLPLVLAVLSAWFLHTHERVQRRVPLPPGGEAATDPLYALRLALQAQGLQVQAYDDLAPDRFIGNPGDTVLLHGDPSAVNARQAQVVMAWVERGGHLVLRTPPRARNASRFGSAAFNCAPLASISSARGTSRPMSNVRASQFGFSKTTKRK